LKTANYYRDSACRSWSGPRGKTTRLLKKRHFLSGRPINILVFTYIHGITWEDVEGQAEL